MAGGCQTVRAANWPLCARVVDWFWKRHWPWEDFAGITEANGDANVHREANQFDYGRPSDPVYGETDPIDPAEAIGPGPNASDDSAGANPLDELEKLMARARAGDAAVHPRLRELLDENAGLLGSFGDVAAHTEAAWIGVMAGGDLGLAEAINVQIAARKRELGGRSPTPVEKVLISGVIATLLQLKWAELAGAQAALDERTTIAQSLHLQAMVSQAFRRHTLAVGALTSYQRLVPRAKDGSVIHMSDGAVHWAPRSSSDDATGTGIHDRAEPSTPAHEARVEQTGAPVNFGVFGTDGESKAVKRDARARRGKRGRSAS